MALKKLLTNLEQGLTAYSNHNTPSDVGGFNYSNSTSIFDTKEFNQKSLRFGEGTAFDRPGGGFSNQPFQTNNITRELGFLLDNYGLLQKIPQGVDTVTDGFIRGGAITHAKRLVQDTERIGRFLLTPKGLSFIVKQRQLQKTNPKIDEPSEGGFLSISHANQRTYNLGINTLASVASAGTGIRIKREGLLPTAHKGYADSDSLFKNNKNNRLRNLFDKHIERGIDGNVLYSYLGGPDSTYGIGRTAISKAKVNIRPGAKVGGLKGVFKKNNNLAWSELDWDVPQYNFLGGIKVKPGDYDKTEGKVSITIPSEHIYDDTEEGEGGDVLFPVTSHLKFRHGRAEKNGKQHHGYIKGSKSFWSTENLMLGLVPPFNMDSYISEEGKTIVNAQFAHIQPNKERDTKDRLNNNPFAWKTQDLFLVSQLTGKGLNGNSQYGQLGMQLDKTLYNISNYPNDKDEGPNNIPYSKHFANPNSRLKDIRPHLRWEPMPNSTKKASNFQMKTKGFGTNYDSIARGSGGKTYHREERISIGNPGAKSSRDGTRDPYIVQVNGKPGDPDAFHDYSVYDSARIDKINSLDVFESEGDFDVHAVRDLIRFRFEMMNNDKPGKSETILFRALLDNTDDNFTATHNTFKYNGRGEEFYTYNSFKRSLNFSFKIAATSRHEMMPLYRKLNFLVANTAPDYGNTGRMRTPFTRLTVGAMWDRIPGVINSVNIKWQKDYPWEISISSPEGNLDKTMNVLPHVMDVSVQFTPVHNFLPEKSIHSPFILSHRINRKMKPGQEWLKAKVSPSLDNASLPDVWRRIDKNHIPIELTETEGYQAIPPTFTSNTEQYSEGGIDYEVKEKEEAAKAAADAEAEAATAAAATGDGSSADATTGVGSVEIQKLQVTPINSRPTNEVGLQTNTPEQSDIDKIILGSKHHLTEGSFTADTENMTTTESFDLNYSLDTEDKGGLLSTKSKQLRNGEWKTKAVYVDEFGIKHKSTGKDADLKYALKMAKHQSVWWKYPYIYKNGNWPIERKSDD